MAFAVSVTDVVPSIVPSFTTVTPRTPSARDHAVVHPTNGWPEVAEARQV